MATIVKVNDVEASELAAIVGCPDDTVALGSRLAIEHGIGLTCVTRGADGAVLWVDGGILSVDAVPVAVADTVGSGDAFAAGLLHGLLAGRPPVEALAFANRLAALVASRPGALPDWHVDEIA
jgi:fructokinase